MLEDKYKLYKYLLPEIQDKYGFTLSDECDSLLFSGLLGSVEGVDIHIDVAQDPSTGQWMRRPIMYPACWDCSNPLSTWQRIKLVLKHILATRKVDKVQISKLFDQGGSSISRDMLLGLAWFAYFNKRLDISEQVIKYALSHYCVMGQGTISRTLLTPGLLSTFAWISYRLGGPNRWWLRCIPAP